MRGIIEEFMIEEGNLKQKSYILSTPFVASANIFYFVLIFSVNYCENNDCKVSIKITGI